MAAAAASLVIRLSALAVVLVVLCPTASAVPLGKRYRVGGPEGWRVPPPQDKEMFYVKWAAPITFFVEDSIEFVYKNDSVIKVSKAGYYHCNETAGIGTGAVPRDGSTLFLLDAPGFAYFASADLGHCNAGERLGPFDLVSQFVLMYRAPSSHVSVTTTIFLYACVSFD
ncbi:early nodulin-like protein 2 [Triticum urartu]|uniref:early nodulin-like protein 2 n=1 Tax=Triticum urartu TaxID=4572 RepID=UPI0020447097|nr:early nodulin-like protein 2 [Triticum urartu]